MLGIEGAFIAQWGIFDQSMQADTWTTNVVADAAPGQTLPYFSANPFNNSIDVCDVSKAYIAVKADCRCVGTNDVDALSPPNLNLYGLQKPIHPLPLPETLNRALAKTRHEANVPFGLDDISPYKMGDEISPLSVKLPDNVRVPKYNIDVPLPVPAMPKFNRKPIVSSDGQFGYYGANACSVPCEQIKVCLTGNLCCFEFVNNEVYAVGNGTVYASVDKSKGDCGHYYPYLTRWGEGAISPEPWHSSPINVCDGDLILVDLIATKEPLNPVPVGLPTFENINPCCYPTCFVYWTNPCLKTYRLTSKMGRPTIVVNPDALKKKMENIRSQKAFKLRQVRRFKKR